jgi:hypothetical protein
MKALFARRQLDIGQERYRDGAVIIAEHIDLQAREGVAKSGYGRRASGAFGYNGYMSKAFRSMASSSGTTLVAYSEGLTKPRI